jgi:hypothetical protein
LRGPAAAAECVSVSRPVGDWRGGHCAKKATSASDGARARAAGPQSALTRQSTFQAKPIGMSFGSAGNRTDTIDGAAGLLCRWVMPSELSGNHVGGGVVSVGGFEGGVVPVADDVVSELPGGEVLSVVF